MSDEQKNIINIDRKKLSKEDVSRKQNLGKILRHHQQATKRPIYRQRKFYFTLFIIMLIAYLIYLSEKENAQPKEEKIETVN